MAKGRLSIVITSRWIYYSKITKTHQSIVPRGLYGSSSSSFSSGPRRVLCWWSWQCLWRFALLLSFFFFFVFFAVEVLFLLRSNKKTKVKMRIKAKKTNSVSENAIRSSYFVIELRKLSTSSLMVKIETCKPYVAGCLHFQLSKWAWGINSDQSYQWRVTCFWYDPCSWFEFKFSVLNHIKSMEWFTQSY